MTFERFEQALIAVVMREVQPLVDRGCARVETVDHQEGRTSWRVTTVTPTAPSACAFAVIAQSDAEVSFFVGPPNDPQSLTVDVYNDDHDELLDAIRAYIDAIVTGRVEVQKGPNSSAGRATFTFANGASRSHSYNTITGRRARRGLVHRPKPY